MGNGVEKGLKVQSDNDLGYTIINKSDYDENVHRLVDDGVPPDPSGPEPTVESLFGPEQAFALAEEGLETLDEIANADLHELAAIGKMGLESAQSLMARARRRK